MKHKTLIQEIHGKARWFILGLEKESILRGEQADILSHRGEPYSIFPVLKFQPRTGQTSIRQFHNGAFDFPFISFHYSP